MEIYRLFAAIRPPDDIVLDLSRLQTGVDSAKWSSPEKFHITLGFFGDVTGEQAELLDEKLAGISCAPFELSLSGVGHFGKSEPHALWVGVNESLELTRLHKAVKSAAQTANVKLERREYTPHVTLAYLKSYPDIEGIVKWEHFWNGFKSGPFLVDRFFLYSSWRRKSGANLYKSEAGYPLLGS